MLQSLSSPLPAPALAAASESGIGTGVVLAIAVLVPVLLALVGAGLRVAWRRHRRARGMRQAQRRLEDEVAAHTPPPTGPYAASVAPAASAQPDPPDPAGDARS